ncbi:MAG: single-stranded DNA-binding protein [Spirochaetaceae bacterium]|nr:single-stranded DNA-binding protein [Spirochaetaceae bacterium]
MANDLNSVALVGRLTRACDMRYTNSGYQICSFSIALTKSRKQADGTWQEQAHFFECTYFGKVAEAVSQYLQKGQQVAIQGSLEQQTWETNGQKRSKVIVIVNSLTLIGRPSNQTSGQNAGYQQSMQNNGYSNQSNSGYNNQQQFGNTQTSGSNGGGPTYNSYKGNGSTPAPAASVVEPSTFAPSITGPEEFDDDIPF